MSGFRYSSGDRPLEGYTIDHALGRGGFGEVYFASSDAGREVALKVIQNYEDIELRGISHCMNLKSPHLVTIFDVKKDDSGRPWVVMEYVAGPALKELLDEAASEITTGHQRSNGIGEEQAVYFMRELIKGMRYLHDAGVVHRDLKPHNIFFEDGAVKIGDYSLSKAISTSQHSGHTTAVGSVHYMAPEIGEGNYGKAVDIYALGVILFEMLTGNPPYVGESMGEVLIKHLTSTPDVTGLAPVLGQVITKAMARNPEQRYQSVDQMLHALCPEDHSSYLPLPASLSLIGQRAAARQRKPPIQTPLGSNTDTFVKFPSLVDTRENSDTGANRQSQPFERPGVILPESMPTWIGATGLWWEPPQPELSLAEPVRWSIRAFTAIGVSLCFAALATALDSMSWSGFALLWGMFLATGFIACWAFRQALPRSNSPAWTIGNRLIGALIVSSLGSIAVFVLEALDFGGAGEELWWALILTGLAIDWRCFIAVDRYPRVGVVKTLVVLMMCAVAMMIMEVNHAETIQACLLMVAASTISIQILAPFGKVEGGEPLFSSGKQQTNRANSSEVEAPIPETRFESDSILLQEKV